MDFNLFTSTGAAPALRKWGGKEVKLIARRFVFISFLLRNEFRPEESGVHAHPNTPRGAALASGCPSLSDILPNIIALISRE